MDADAIAAIDPCSPTPSPGPDVDATAGLAFTIEAADGYRLAANRFVPHGAPRGAIVIPSAMGVKQSFYAPFAAFLARRGYVVVTFDYRGVGGSAPRRMRNFSATLDDWARLDYDAALRCARLATPADRKLLVIGHSLAGQLAGLVPSRSLIDGLVTVASGSGYWRENVPRLKRSVWFLWYVAVPFWTTVAGYFPGGRLRKIADLPKGVMRQWSRWCRDRDYHVGVEGPEARTAFASIGFPLLALSFTDDELMSARNIDALHALYANAPQIRRRIAPADVGARRIGHFGFFRPTFAATLWDEMGRWLDDASGTRQASCR